MDRARIYLIIIAVLLFTVGGLLYIGYGIDEDAKLATQFLEKRITVASTEFEDIMDERTKNILDTVRVISEKIQKILEHLEGINDAKKN